MTKQELFENIQRKKSFLCVGLDTDVNKIPEHLFDETDDAIFAFNKAIIDATADLCVAQVCMHQTLNITRIMKLFI